jgi:hypothetical protein
MKTKNAYTLLFLIVLPIFQIGMIEAPNLHFNKNCYCKGKGSKVELTVFTRNNYSFFPDSVIDDNNDNNQSDPVYSLKTFRSGNEQEYQVKFEYDWDYAEEIIFAPYFKQRFIICITDLPPPSLG